jgi:hypothetical protein
VLRSIDSGKHDAAKAVFAKVRTGQGGGIPWMAILDADGQPLVTSDGPKGNIGCPFEAHEIEWFRTMLERTRSKLTDEDLKAIQAANEAIVAKWRQKKG